MTTRKQAARVRTAQREKAVSISDVARANAKLRRPSVAMPDVAGLFAGYRPAPGVLPAEAPPIAMDNALAPWASDGVGAFAGIFASLVAEGQIFLGFPVLSELAQRPEFRTMVDTIATEMTRKWIRFKASGEDDKSSRIAELESAFKKFRVRSLFKEVAEHDGFFGRSHLHVDLGRNEDAVELSTPIGDGWNATTKAKVKKGSLKGLKAVEPVWCYPTEYNSSDPLRDDFYAPQAWFVMGRKIHRSRFLSFVGREVPDLLKPAYAFGGVPLTQMARPYVENWLTTRQSVADLIRMFSTMVMSTNMQAVLSGGSGESVFARVDIFNDTRSNRGTMVIDKDTEDLKNVSTPLGTLDALQAQAQEHLSAVSRIPLVKLTGISPSGLNASSDGEIRVFYDFIRSCQETLFAENLHAVMGFVMHHLWGEPDPDIEFEFVELWEMSAKEKAEIRKMEADTDAVLVNDCSALSPAEVRARVANDPDTPYHGLDIDDLPEPVEEPDADVDRLFDRSQPRLADDSEWHEEDHPRRTDGKFGEGGGPPATPSEKQAAALRAYTGASYRQINGHLVGGQPASDQTIETIKHLDEYLASHPLDQPAIVYRGAGSLAVKDILNQVGGKLKKGAVLDLRGFTSTSSDAGVARRFASVSSSALLIEMRLPKGAHAVDISSHSDSGSAEKETLIARNSRFKVVSFDQKSKKLVVEMVASKKPEIAQDNSLRSGQLEDAENRFVWSTGAGISVTDQDDDDGEVVLTLVDLGAAGGGE